MMHGGMVDMDMNKIMPQQPAIETGPGKKERKPYYQSMSMPPEMFGDNIPKVGLKHRFEIMGEVKEVRKTKNGVEVKCDMMSGKCLSHAGKASDEEFKDMNPKQREEYQKKEVEERMAEEHKEKE